MPETRELGIGFRCRQNNLPFSAPQLALLRRAGFFAGISKRNNFSTVKASKQQGIL